MVFFNDDLLGSLKAFAIPITKLMDSPAGLHPDYAEAFKGADVVFGLNVMEMNDPAKCIKIFDGKGWFQEMAHRSKGQMLNLFAVTYSDNANQGEALSACCLNHRGGCDVK